jgi:hypothetical protein
VAMIEKYYSDARSKDFETALTSGYRKVSATPVNFIEPKLNVGSSKIEKSEKLDIKTRSKPVRKKT